MLLSKFVCAVCRVVQGEKDPHKSSGSQSMCALLLDFTMPTTKHTQVCRVVQDSTALTRVSHTCVCGPSIVFSPSLDSFLEFATTDGIHVSQIHVLLLNITGHSNILHPSE